MRMHRFKSLFVALGLRLFNNKKFVKVKSFLNTYGKQGQIARLKVSGS